ncbi:nuclear transport factor 2 family protein [Lactiplantibacillus fabifermentans]|nr:nuclear transport factor 2 family protein [Lactiplantibacillus fabifermentans]ETY74427.1 hypothetical protein LFAB_06375 [Lactiplantibacillus fabifermentans T30PCM01]
MTPENLIRTYFDCWVQRQFPPLTTFFTTDCDYRECYGARYHGLPELQAWIEHQLQTQVVTSWTIERFLPVSTTCYVVTWNFQAQTDVLTNFDGNSVIDFHDGRICQLTEYETKHQTFRPFAN